MSIFLDRSEAGQILAKKLEQLRTERPVVVALPRGGVPVGLEIARQLDAPLEVVVVRKLGAPGNAEYGFGAIAEDGSYWINEDAAQSVGATGETLKEIVHRETVEIKRRVEIFKPAGSTLRVTGRTVILTDDGLATGVTAVAAARYLKNKGARKIILAVPVCAPDSARRLEAEVDEVICLERPENFYAVGAWYDDFAQLTDDEVLGILAMSRDGGKRAIEVEIKVGKNISLPGDLVVPGRPRGLVVFAHGSGSSRKSSRNIEVANRLNRSGLATLLFDLLTAHESNDRENVFDIALLGRRLIHAVHFAQSQPWLQGLPLGLFGASTGAAAALDAAAMLGSAVSAVVSRGGRPDLAYDHLTLVTAPTLLIVGQNDVDVLELNRDALSALRHARLHVVPSATHLFEEKGALEQVAEVAAGWFEQCLKQRRPGHAA